MTGPIPRLTLLLAAWVLIGLNPARPASAQDDPQPQPQPQPKAKAKAKAKSKTATAKEEPKAESTPRRGPLYALVPTSSKRVKAVLGFELKGPRILADEWSAFATMPPKLPGQFDIRATLTPRGAPDRELGPLARQLLVGKLVVQDENARHNLTARVEYQLTLQGRKLEPHDPDEPIRPAVPALDAKVRRMALESTRAFDHRTESFRSWLVAHDLRRDSDEDPVDFARRAFLVVRKGIKHYEGENVEHVASEAARAGKSDFAGITAIYVAALRANGIPTRALGGFPIVSEGRPNKKFWAHAKTEFYVQGIGWVPADIAGAIRMNRTDDGLDCFGQDAADFLTTHIDNDVIIETSAGPKTVEYLPDVAWWFSGAGSFDGLKVNHTLTVQIETIPNPEPTAR
jgi:transglutaminase-like putative cysteine protease